MNYGALKPIDVSNGEGIRVSLFVSGCTHHCEGCFNPETWNFNYGEKYTEETQNKVLEYLKPDYIQGLTILGGEPFEDANRPVVLGLIKTVKKLFPNKDIWMYSGYLFEEIMKKEYGKEILSLIDILVDGEFVKAKKDLTLKFRGSSNQRIIDVKNTIKSGTISISNKFQNAL